MTEPIADVSATDDPEIPLRNCGGDDVHRGQSSAYADHADQDVGKRNEAFRHAAFGHDRAREHEERNGQHRHLAHTIRNLEHDRFKVARRSTSPRRSPQVRANTQSARQARTG
jgi:hypothetical protein